MQIVKLSDQSRPTISGHEIVMPSWLPWIEGLTFNDIACNYMSKFDEIMKATVSASNIIRNIVNVIKKKKKNGQKRCSLRFR